MKHWRILSLLIAIGICVLAYKTNFFADLGEQESRSASGIFSQIAATMLGFLIAAISIIASISSNRFMRTLKTTGHYNNLLKSLFFCSGSYALTMVVSLAALMTKLCFPWPPLVALGFFAFATLLLADVGKKLWLVLGNLAEN